MVARGNRLSCATLVAALACWCGLGCGDSKLPQVVIQSVSPDEVEEGTSLDLSIVGSGFHVRLGADLDDGVVQAGGVEVFAGSSPLTNVVVVSESEITANAPVTLPIGIHDLRVVFADGREGSLTDGFEVYRLCTDASECQDDDPCTTSEDCVGERCVLGDPDKDADGDSYIDADCGGDDCDDDPAACGAGCSPGFVGADECDGYDQDCDGSTDEDGGNVFYHDADGDGFTSMADSQVACDDPDGDGSEWLPAATADDCADTPGADPLCGGLDGSVCNPSEIEGPMGDASCLDGADNNCNGTADNDELACACGGDCSMCSGCCLESCPPEGCANSCTACTCYFDCNDAPGACATTCTGSANCNVDCVGAATCSTSCTASVCDVDCRDSTSCDVSCTNTSSCTIDCRGSSNCSSVECKSNSSCLLQCDGVGPCDFSSCPGGGGMTCPGNIIVCNRSCP